MLTSLSEKAIDHFLLVIRQGCLNLILPLCEARFQKPAVFTRDSIQALNQGYQLVMLQKKEALADIQPLGLAFIRHFD
jgi:hypothetical protein